MSAPERTWAAEGVTVRRTHAFTEYNPVVVEVRAAVAEGADLKAVLDEVGAEVNEALGRVQAMGPAHFPEPEEDAVARPKRPAQGEVARAEARTKRAVEARAPDTPVGKVEEAERRVLARERAAVTRDQAFNRKCMDAAREFTRKVSSLQEEGRRKALVERLGIKTTVSEIYSWKETEVDAFVRKLAEA